MAAAMRTAADRAVPSVLTTTGVTPVVVLKAGLAPGVAVPAVLSTAGLAPEVMGQLALVLGAARAGGLSGVTSEQALQVVEAAESVKAWVDSVVIDATAVMVTELETDFTHLAPESLSSRGWRLFFRSCRSAAAREIQVATGLPITQCQRRVWLTACEPERVGSVRDAMRLGRVTLARAMTLAEATKHLDGLTAAAIAARVLRPLTGPDGVPLPGVAPLSEATFRARLHKQLVLHHGLIGEAERTYTEAVKVRRLSVEPRCDGTGLMLISGDGSRIAAARGRVDTIARRLRKGGDTRTLDQLRADVATDLLMRGWIPNDPTFTRLGKPPSAVVQMLVSLSTALGLDEGVGQITGWGPVPGSQARQLALQAGSIWNRLVTDPITGRAIEVSATTYKVPAGMAEQINARDGTCRAPGCEIPGERCDFDHSKEWEPRDAGGPTAETNLADLHRGHHNLKTSGFWDSDQSADGTLQWTTAVGRTVTTYPYVYDHPDNLPVETSSLEQCIGRQLTEVINPDIPLPNDIFDQVAWSRALAPATLPPTQYTFAGRHHETKQPEWKASLTGDPPF
ncbi:MAG: HNH endonuclease signature motif containing protein [Dermatophilaceae bacterium]